MICIVNKKLEVEHFLLESRANAVTRTRLVQPDAVSLAPPVVTAKAWTPPVCYQTWDELTFEVPYLLY